ncbi:MAG: transposase family protein [Acidovorax sp.]|nr:transposase family protein [Acidovorax sp.]
MPTSAEMTLQYPPNIPDSRVQRLPRHELQAILVMTLCATIAGADKTGGGGMDV